VAKATEALKTREIHIMRTMRITHQLNRALILLLLTCALCAACQASDSDAGVAKGEHVTDVEWFRDAKFGMFIHWGLSSHLGGNWEGQRYYGITEWIMRRGEIPSADYKAKARDFNPVDFDAEEWVATARAAGARYIVITSKHHDGFAVFDSAVSDFDIVDATPYGKDPLKALTAAAQAAGIKIGFYYSQFQDWTEPDAGGNEWEFNAADKVFERYLEAKAKPQLRELLTNYGPIDIIWFDTPGSMSREEAIALKAWIKDLQPGCLVSDRVGHDLGDYKGYGDGEIPAIPQPGRPWEAIFTHNDSWGYSHFDNNFKSTSEVLHMLVTIAGKGGNLLLNIGPDGRGRFPAESVRVFREVGHWLDANGEAIYGSGGSPVGGVPWGAITQKPGKLYLLVERRPDDGRLLVPGFGPKASKASLLANGAGLELEQAGSDLVVSLPEAQPDPRVNVVVVEYDENDPATFERSIETLVSGQYGPVILDSVTALTSDRVSFKRTRTMHYFGDWKNYQTLNGLKSPEDSVSWKLRVGEPGSYRLVLSYSASAAQSEQEGLLTFAGKDHYFRVLETGDFNDPGGFAKRKPIMFIDHPVAVVQIDEPGVYEISLRPDQAGENLMMLRHVTIEPHD
jgi:alpha-L-fucosidase